MKIVEIKKLIDQNVDDIHEGMEVISSIGNRGKVIQMTTTTKNLNDFWIKILWETGNVSSGPLSEKERWASITLPS